VQISTLDFGGTSGLDYIFWTDFSDGACVYYHMIQYFVNYLGYSPGLHIRGAPYDWRYRPDQPVGRQYLANLKSLVEYTYHNNGETQVTLVSHSMGCLYTLYFLNHQTFEWKSKYIKSWIPIGGPFGGAVQALKVLITGDFFQGSLDIPLNAQRDFASTLPTTYWLLPSTRVWGNQGLVVAPNKVYSAFNYDSLLQGLGFGHYFPTYQKASRLVGSLEDPGVAVFNLFGTHVNTPEAIFLSAQTSIRYGDGDGTVNTQSAQAPSNENWALYVYRAFPGVTHLDLIKNTDVIYQVAKLVLE